MAKGNAEIAILNQLAPWVQHLKYNAIEQMWHAQFLPNKIVITASMRKVVLELEKHVINELIELFSEALDVNIEFFRHAGRNRPNADARFAAAIVIKEQFNTIRDGTIGEVLGWKNHTGAIHARKQQGVKEVDVLIARIYGTFPQLKTGEIIIYQP